MSDVTKMSDEELLAALGGGGQRARSASELSDQELLQALGQAPSGPTPLGKAGSALAQGMNVGLANVLGAPVDIVNLGLRTAGLPVSEQPFLGSAFIREKLLTPTVQAAGAAGRAAGLEVSPDIRAGYGSLEEIPQQYRPFARAGEVLGSAAPLAVAPVVAATARPMAQLATPSPTAGFIERTVSSAGMQPAAFLAKEAGIAGGAAQGAGIAEMVAPGSPVAALTGEVLGSIASPTSLVSRGATTVSGAFTDALKRTTAAGRKEIGFREIGDALLQAGENPEALRRALQPQVLARMSPEELAQLGLDQQTVQRLLATADQTGAPLADLLSSPTLVGMQDQLAARDPIYAKKLAEKRQTAAVRMGEEVRVAAAPGSPEALRKAAQGQADELTKGIEDYVTDAEARAADAAAKFRPQPGVRADANTRAREVLEEAETNARNVEKQLWNLIPNRDAQVAPNRFLATVQEMKGRLLPTEDLPSPIKGLDQAYADEAPTVSSLLTARSRLLALARDARSGATPDRTAAVMYDNLAQAALDDVSAIAGEAGKQARAFSYALNERFSRSFAGDVLGARATGGERIAPEMTLERAMAGGGPAAEVRMRELEQATQPLDFNTIIGAGKTRDLSPQMRTIQENFLRTNAEKFVDPMTGTVNPRQVEKFLRENKDLMQRFPGLSDDLRAAAKAVEDVGLATQGTSAAQNRLAALAKVANVEDPVRLVQTALNGPTPNADISSLVGIAQRGGPEAIAGLRGAVFDAVMGPEAAKDFAQIRTALFEPMSKDRPALIKILRDNGVVTATQQANLKRLIEKGEAFQKAAASGRDDVSIEGVNSPFFDFLLRVGGAKAGASGVLGQATGSELVAASAGSKYFRKIFDATPQAKLQELYKEILDNPKLLDDVLFQAGSRAEQRRKFQSINAALVQAGIMAPIDFSKDEEERRPMEITVNPRRQ
jgi:hypothetical protein